MSARLLLPLLLGLAACGGNGAKEHPGDDRSVECAVGGGVFERVCTAELTPRSDGRVLTIRHPGGGFRRLLIATDGRGVVAADGAERAQVRVLGPDRIEVSLGGNLYRLPANVRGSAAR